MATFEPICVLYSMLTLFALLYNFPYMFRLVCVLQHYFCIRSLIYFFQNFVGDEHVVLFHVGQPFFFSFFIWILFVAGNEAVDCDKGNFPVKDKSVLISIDDLVADKIGGQSTDVTRRSNTEGHVVEGNGILFSFISYIFYHYFRPIFHQVMSCSFPPLFSFSVDGFTYSTPPIIAPAPTKKIGSSTPRTRLRRVRVIQPSKSLLPPFSCITSSKKEDSID